MTFSLNDLESQIRALEGASVSTSDLSDADSSVSESQSSETESFSGYSCDSSDTSESDASEGSEEGYINQRVDQGKVNYEKKARETSRKKARFGMSDICFKFNIGQCRLEDCIFRHVKLESLNEEEKGDLVRDLRRKPFDPELGLIVKQLNIPICKTFSKTGELLARMEVKKKSKSEKSKPLEFSCRAPVAVPKPQRQGLIKRAEEYQDPRFNRDVAGDFNTEMFGKAYGFLNDYRECEKKEMAVRLNDRSISAAEKDRISKSLSRMASQDVARAKINQESQIRKELMKKELDLVEKTGKKAYFHPRSAIKKVMRERKEAELQSKGQLDQYRAKREKRKNSADRKTFSIPKTRRVVEFQ